MLLGQSRLLVFLKFNIRAISIDKSNCIAIISKDKNNQSIIKRLNLFGIKNIIFIDDYFLKNLKFDQFNNIQSEKDLLNIKLPFEFSNNLIYDEFCDFKTILL